MVKKQLGGGKDQAVKFDWSKFPQTPGEEFQATKIEVQWSKDSVTCKGSKDTNFTGYGKFRISKYVTPNDDLWTGPTENVAFNANGDLPYRQVHSNWITRVRGQEGRGFSQNEIYQIKRVTNTSAPVSYYLIPTEEGAYVKRLTVNHSLAKHESDGRFAAHDDIVLATDTGSCFAIEDTGNWTDGNNHLDRFGGTVGPDDLNTDFPSSYVVRVK